MQHRAALYFNDTYTDDAINTGIDTDLSSVNLSLNSRYGEIVETNVALNNSIQQSLGGHNLFDNKNAAVYGRYMVLPRRLWVNGSVRSTFADGGNDRVTPFPDTTAISDPAEPVG